MQAEKARSARLALDAALASRERHVAGVADPAVVERAIAGRCNADLDRASIGMKSTGHHFAATAALPAVELDGSRFRVVVEGDERGVPIVFLAGGPGNDFTRWW